MNAIASKISPLKLGSVFGALTIAAIGLLVMTRGVTCNQALAVGLSMLVLTIWWYDKVNGIIAAIVFYMVKAFFLRVAFAIDFHASGSGGLDILGVTPALLLAGLIGWQLYNDISCGKPILADRTRVLLAVFCGMAFLSIFNPANTLLVGMGGLVRNILPNMMILFVAASLFTQRSHLEKLVRALLVVGLVSCAYAVGQYALGLYPWEITWFNEVAFKDEVAGWLTIGLRGLEFRLFSIFYGYMDFFFTNVLIFVLAVACSDHLSGNARKLRAGYIALWIAVLVLSLERMPMLMSLVAAMTIYFLKSTPRRKRAVVWTSVVTVVLTVVLLNVATPYLINTGANKLIRLAEMANPLSASSIGDRAERKWTPTLATIKSNPLGVGIGYGSSSRANASAASTGYHVQPHNEVLQKTLETGIVGGIVYILLLASIFGGARRTNGKSDIRQFAYAIMAGSLAFWICGLVNVPFSGANGLLYWMMAGAMLGLKQKTTVPSVRKSPKEELTIS